MKSQALAVPDARIRPADLLALTKPRLNALVVVTTAVGYHLSAGAGDWPRFLHTIAGTALVAAGASALNQVSERDVDALMRRTMGRPLPDGRLRPVDAAIFGAALALTGLLQLALAAGALAAGLALTTLVIYIAIYTPLKRRTSFSTVVGAVPGALPPMIGWAAARGTLDTPAWLLFAIVFLWQLPHFLAIAWMYREDYERAGLPLLPVIDPDGRSTGRQAVLYAAVLVPVTLAPAAVGLAGSLYFGAALVLGSAFVALAVRFARARTTAAARLLFVGSILYLPLLWTMMLVDRS